MAVTQFNQFNVPPQPPDMLRGTQIAKWAGLDQESICSCGHKFENGHIYWKHSFKEHK